MKYSFDDPNFINEFLKIVDEYVDKKINSAPFDRSVYAKVVSVPSGRYCDIKLNNEGETISNVLINDGLTISNGDDVYITYIKNQKSNYLITKKK
jgi:hypothetical protein